LLKIKIVNEFIYFEQRIDLVFLDKEHLIMQFGRMSANEFFCDFRYPLSLMQAFGIALSAFDSRLFRD